jgi:hypothetical protein
MVQTGIYIRVYSSNMAHMGQKRNAYMVGGGNPEERRQFGRCKQRGENNIKTDIKEIGWECVG